MKEFLPSGYFYSTKGLVLTDHILHNLVLSLVWLLAIVSLPCALCYFHIREDRREG